MEQEAKVNGRLKEIANRVQGCPNLVASDRRCLKEVINLTLSKATRLSHALNLTHTHRPRQWAKNLRLYIYIVMCSYTHTYTEAPTHSHTRFLLYTRTHEHTDRFRHMHTHKYNVLITFFLIRAG